MQINYYNNNKQCVVGNIKRFYCKFLTESIDAKIFKIGQHLQKLRMNNIVSFFMTHNVC